MNNRLYKVLESSEINTDKLKTLLTLLEEEYVDYADGDDFKAIILLMALRGLYL
jgi:hypothetical protein